VLHGLGWTCRVRKASIPDAPRDSRGAAAHSRNACPQAWSDQLLAQAGDARTRPALTSWDRVRKFNFGSEKHDAYSHFNWRDCYGRSAFCDAADVDPMVSRKELINISGQGLRGGWKARNSRKRSRRSPEALTAGGPTLRGWHDLLKRPNGFTEFAVLRPADDGGLVGSACRHSGCGAGSAALSVGDTNAPGEASAIAPRGPAGSEDSVPVGRSLSIAFIRS
jgi:hypothetical protein